MYQNHIIYTTPILSVNENDTLVFRIDLIQDNKIVDCINFFDFSIQAASSPVYEKTHFIKSQKFDKLRDCELEIMVNFWHEEFAVEKFDGADGRYRRFFDDLRGYFGRVFDVLEIIFDVSKKFLIKVVLKASKIGFLKKGEFCNKNIRVVPENTVLQNECVPISFVQTFDLSKTILIRKGTRVIFYFEE